MSSDTKNHSFSLQPKASDIVNGIKDQKKSAFVSDAIVFYDSKKKLGQIPGPREIADDKTENVPQHRGGERSFVHNWLLSLIKRDGS